MTCANLQTEWAALLFASLADAGIRDVIISPGSRSTPLVVAAVREPRLARHELVDERAAAFFALGQARVTGRPSVLVCTSGTAPAHYLPALIEANVTGVPVLVLSADRPHELYDCRAPQTIDQVKLFGENARQFFDLVADPSDASLRALRRVAAQAVLASRWPRAGAVHMNARWRKPLEPAAASGPEEERLAERARAVGREPIVAAPAPRVVASKDALGEAAKLVGASRRGVVVAGPAALDQRRAREAVWALAETTGFAVAAEATSQLRFAPTPPGVRLIDALDLTLRTPAFRARAAFDLAVQIGAAPTSGAWERASPSIPRVVIAEHGWNDPHSSARVMVFGDVEASCAELAAAVRSSGPRVDPSFGPYLDAANAAAWSAADRELEAIASSSFVEAHAVRALLERAPEGSLLVLGNSLSVRLVDIYGRASTRDLGVLSQRGASGIDGLVAGATGAAVASGKPTALLLGDVSLLHDLTSLRQAARVKTPLVVFALHNGGGRIFEQLPIADVRGLEAPILEHATTPHDTDFSHAAALFGVRFARVGAARELRPALDDAYAHGGCTLIEVRVEPSGAIATGRRVASAVEAAIAALPEEAT